MNSATHPDPAAAVTRLAPSPTGALHLGNVRTFLVNWALARRHGWRVILRIEDLDTPRVKPEAERQTIDLLEWLGLDWDEGPIRQSDDLPALGAGAGGGDPHSPYAAALARLAAAGIAYPCELSRSEVEAAASAPHERGDTPDRTSDPAAGGELRYPPELRPAPVPRDVDPAAETNWRFAAPDETVAFTDAHAGEQRRNPFRSVGDFVIWTKRRQPAYQLAVVVDDARQGVTHVVRGDDLLDSTARQLLLYRALGLPEPRVWMHLPLVLGPDGRRLAKRHGDTRAAHYRARGVSPERLIGLLAYWSGASARRAPMSASEFVERFDPGTMPAGPITCTPEDDAWLLH